jgi:hypothetical protein
MARKGYSKPYNIYPAEKLIVKVILKGTTTYNLELGIKLFYPWGERWSGFLGQGTGLYKWETALSSHSCRNLFLR